MIVAGLSFARSPMTRTIGIVIFPGVEELDFVGPWEIFTMTRSLDSSTCDVFTVSENGGEVVCAKGLRVLADHSFASAPPADPPIGASAIG